MTVLYETLSIKTQPLLQARFPLKLNIKYIYYAIQSQTQVRVI